MTFAAKLRELRDAIGMSEAKLADAAGLPFASIHSYGLGRRAPSFTAVVKIARALGASCEAFADCDDVQADAAAKAPSGKKKAAKKRKGK